MKHIYGLCRILSQLQSNRQLRMVLFPPVLTHDLSHLNSLQRLGQFKSTGRAMSTIFHEGHSVSQVLSHLSLCLCGVLKLSRDLSERKLPSKES